MESMQKYIEVLEENLELRNTLPFHVIWWQKTKIWKLKSRNAQEIGPETATIVLIDLRQTCKLCECL
jgi:hypothetical protein